MERHIRSIGTLSCDELEKISKSKVAVVGCGGLGGHVLEMLARTGVGHLVAIDGDVFEESNLNRQLLATMNTLGCSKSEEAKNRIKEIDPNLEVTAYNAWITGKNAESFLEGCSVVVDALDSVEARFLVQKACEELGVPMVHGAIGGWYGQVTVIFPGERTLEKLYQDSHQKGVEKQLGNPSFTPGVVASIQAAEVIKVLIRRGNILRKRVLRVDLLEQEFVEIEV